MYGLHLFFPNIPFVFFFSLVLFHKNNRFRTQCYNSIEKIGFKKEYESTNSFSDGWTDLFSLDG